jgi:hypothetical protein
VELPYEDRLGLDKAMKVGTSTSRKQLKVWAKEVKRAYYKKSLQWHPDRYDCLHRVYMFIDQATLGRRYHTFIDTMLPCRWAGMSMYAVAVQGAFELVNEAYESIRYVFRRCVYVHHTENACYDRVSCLLIRSVFVHVWRLVQCKH